MRVFVAGATGAIGRPLVQRLVEDGHHVVGSTRTEEGADWLRDVGVVPAVVDMTDLDLVENVVAAALPDVVINQLTSLPKTPEPDELAEGVAATSALRRRVYPKLAEAAAAAGARRLIVQSTAFGPTDGTDVRDVIESSAVGAEIEAVVLRYGYFYGPGTWSEDRPEAALNGDTDALFVHIDNAVEATVQAISETEPGIHVVVD
jgi:nucleoside-diphosphate-sugar epimerase